MDIYIIYNDVFIMFAFRRKMSYRQHDKVQMQTIPSLVNFCGKIFHAFSNKMLYFHWMNRVYNSDANYVALNTI
jgi:hypothetical protein